MKNDLPGRSYDALLAGAKGVLSSTCYDASGYAPCWRENLLPSLPLSPIAADLEQGAGAELHEKLRAAHSSAAIVINTFGPWRDNPAGLRVAGLVDFTSLRFEVKCPSGLAGTPPHVDLLAEGKTLLAVESKCTEWMRRK